MRNEDGMFWFRRGSELGLGGFSIFLGWELVWVFWYGVIFNFNYSNYKLFFFSGFWCFCI